MQISKKTLNAVGENLDKLQPPQLPEDFIRDMSLKEVITSLAPNLLNMRRRGFTTDEILKALKENNVTIKGPTLNRYLNEYKPFKPPKKKKTAPDASANQETVESPDDEDCFTPVEETPSEQPDHTVETRPDPPENSSTPEEETAAEQTGYEAATRLGSLR